MTHMTNYANDRLAPYLLKKLVKFVQRWTNLKLVSAPPKQLADIYFNVFPEEVTPVWQVSYLIANMILILRKGRLLSTPRM